jgi:hypothetical protein
MNSDRELHSSRSFIRIFNIRGRSIIPELLIRDVITIESNNWCIITFFKGITNSIFLYYFFLSFSRWKYNF